MQNYNDKSTSAAVLVRNEFQAQLVMTLREVPWNFARRSEELQAVGGEQPTGVYFKPVDYVRLWWDDSPDGNAAMPTLTERGPFLCTFGGREQSLVDYIGLAEFDDTPAHFRMLLKYRLAHLVSLAHSSLQRQVSIKTELMAERDTCIAIERSQVPVERVRFTEVGRGTSPYTPYSAYENDRYPAYR